jgi:signal transduction histidine kinase
LPAAIDLAALRIVREAVANVRSHAAAHSCTVTVEVVRSVLHLSVVDDGVGIPAHPRLGVGLLSIRERARELGVGRRSAQIQAAVAA